MRVAYGIVHFIRNLFSIRFLLANVHMCVFAVFHHFHGDLLKTNNAHFTRLPSTVHISVRRTRVTLCGPGHTTFEQKQRKCAESEQN